MKLVDKWTTQSLLCTREMSYQVERVLVKHLLNPTGRQEARPCLITRSYWQWKYRLVINYRLVKDIKDSENVGDKRIS